jgi:hypothetical protein
MKASEHQLDGALGSPAPFRWTNVIGKFQAQQKTKDR